MDDDDSYDNRKAAKPPKRHANQNRRVTLRYPSLLLSFNLTFPFGDQLFLKSPSKQRAAMVSKDKMQESRFKLEKFLFPHFLVKNVFKPAAHCIPPLVEIEFLSVAMNIHFG